MALARNKISSVSSDFFKGIAYFERFDANNQKNFASKPRKTTLTELHILTESIFFRMYRGYERTVRDIFLLYCLEKGNTSRKKVTSHLKATSFLHAEKLIRSTQKHLDWGNPNLVINWAELYLKDGYPIKPPFASNLVVLNDLRTIRNHIAHDSAESLQRYKSVLQRHYGTLPLEIPCPGKFLLENDKSDPNKYKLLVYIDVLKDLVSGLCQ